MPVGSNIKRAPLDNRLWTALGNTSGAIYSGLVGAGYVLRMAPFTVTAQTGFRVTGVALGGFNESGSELGLAVNSINYTSPSALASLDLTLDRRQSGAWIIVPSLTLIYERMLGDHRTRPRLSKPRQQDDGGDREDDADDFIAVERFIEEKKAHAGEQQDHTDRVDRADRRQL